MISDRENMLRAIQFRNPEWIPCSAMFLPIVWKAHREKLEDVLLRHPRLFKDFKGGSVDFDHPGDFYRRGDFPDNWGCLWHVEIDGAEGQVVEHPLEDWASLDAYQAPDPLKTADRGPVDWDAIRHNSERAKREGRLTGGSVPHGYLFMRLGYLRGYENFLLDLATDDPHLHRLIEVIHRHNKALVGQYLRLGVDQMSFNEDLGAAHIQHFHDRAQIVVDRLGRVDDQRVIGRIGLDHRAADGNGAGRG